MTDIETTIDQAIEYALAYVYMGRTRLDTLGTDASPGVVPLNAGFAHDRELCDASTRWVTTPNADTLYSRAYLDLTAGPVKVTMPDTTGRYYSVAFMDMASNNFEVGGRRKTGTRAAEWLVVGPGYAGPLPGDCRVLQAPGNDVLVLVRTLIDGPADLAAMHTVQDGMSCVPLASNGQQPPRWTAAEARQLPAGTSPEAFVTMANIMLGRNPPPTYETALLAKFASVGISADSGAWGRLSPTLHAQWAARLPAFMRQLKKNRPLIEKNNWRYSHWAVGNFGTAYAERTAIAVGGLLALPNEEAVYPNTGLDGSGRRLSGANGGRYRLHLPKGTPQVGAFWSMTMYEVHPCGSLWFTENAIGRYVIGDRTPGLVTNKGGSVDVYMQHAAPEDKQQRANWLPAPRGPFILVFRAYEPGADLRDLRQPLLGVERLPSDPAGAGGARL